MSVVRRRGARSLAAAPGGRRFASGAAQPLSSRDGSLASDRARMTTPTPAPPPGLQPGGAARPDQPPAKRPRFLLSWRVAAIVLTLFALNFWASQRATQPPSRVRVPYSPVFLTAVANGEVLSITSKGTAIQGTFARPESYSGSRLSKLFDTEIPAFADTTALSKLLEAKKVVVNAEPLTTSAPWWESVLLGFGPTILFVGLLLFAVRRAGNVQGMLGAFGRSRARRYEPSGEPVTFADVAGIDEAKAELTEVVDFLRNPEKYQRLGGGGPPRGPLRGPPGAGGEAVAPRAGGGGG